jgi:hemoglobin
MDNTSFSIFSKIGGINALHNIVDSFYDKVMADETVNHFFADADMDIQRGKMKAFLMMALGGPVKFTGKDMRKAHVHLVAGGLTDKHYNAIGNHLDASLKEYGVDETTRTSIAKVVESVRKDVLNM